MPRRLTLVTRRSLGQAGVMNNGDSAAISRIHGRRSSFPLAGLALGLTLLALTAVVQVTPVLAGITAEAPVSTTVTGGTLDGSIGLTPGNRITLTPIVIEARRGDMLYALHADLLGSDQLIRQVHATARTADGALLYDGPLARLSIGADAMGFPARRLAAGTAERLSVTIAVSLDAGNEIQGATLAVIWRGDAIAAGEATTGPAAQD